MQIQLQTYLDHLEDDQKSERTIQHYIESMKATGITSFDPDNLSPIWQDLLVKLENKTSYGFIEGMIKVLRGTLKLYGITWTHDFHYNKLVTKLRKYGSEPEAYTADQIKQILNACQSTDWNLFRLAILCTYSGLRVSSAEGLKYADFEKNDLNGVYLFPVTSKGRKYTAAISNYAYDLMRTSNFEQSGYVVEYDPYSKTPFAKLYRRKMTYMLVKKGLTGIMQNKVPFHSMRKFFGQQLAQRNVHLLDMALLMGHAPPETTAYRFYVNELELKDRIASAYRQSDLDSLRLV